MYVQLRSPLPITCSNLLILCHGSKICIDLIHLKSKPSLATFEPMTQLLLIHHFYFQDVNISNSFFKLFVKFSWPPAITIYLAGLNSSSN